MASSTADTVTIDRLEYASLLRDRALAEKVRGMAVVTALVRTSLGTYRYHVRGDVVGTGHTPEEALGIEEVRDE